MRAKVICPDLLKPWEVTIIGFEDPPGGGDDDNDDDDSDDDDDSENDDSGSGGEGKGGDETAGLKSALDKERRERKRLEKEAKQLRKFKEESESKDDSDKDKAVKEAEREKAKTVRLAEKLKGNAVDTAIIKLAGKHKFRDVDDALRLLNRDSIDVDQDEDEPDDVEVDEKSVDKALKALASAKPHLILADGEEHPSGSKFGGRKKDDQQADEEALRDKYPALRR